MMNLREYKASMGGVRYAHKILLGKSGRKRPLGRPKKKCVEILGLRVWSGFE
jgi:hypothetical protein